MPVTPQGRAEGAEQKRETAILPKTSRITCKDMINFGYTPECPGCRAAANDLKHRPHTAECRIKLEEKAMLEYDVGSNRVEETKARKESTQVEMQEMIRVI